MSRRSGFAGRAIAVTLVLVPLAAPANEALVPRTVFAEEFGWVT